MTTVGDKYVNEAMVANGYVLGGEQSGHIIFSKHATTGDGILTALMLMEVILEKKQSRVMVEAQSDELCAKYNSCNSEMPMLVLRKIEAGRMIYDRS